MENTELKQDQILEKKMNDYSSTLRDFKAEGELLVTITLNEYRSWLTIGQPIETTLVSAMTFGRRWKTCKRKSVTVTSGSWN